MGWPLVTDAMLWTKLIIGLVLLVAQWALVGVAITALVKQQREYRAIRRRWAEQDASRA
jgi:hypothetical protein